ncbi:LysR family transcriptional regulator [Lacticaseibacillus nasuensis]|uniref:LysR family transcriptional regulator n=1 Tax=Lacticaseibacillus nasuensis TaxID=944671 RepID=UPI0006D08B92|nr:LysR family transcriptional regulator [Lacticaseibacillus nasuensis]
MSKIQILSQILAAAQHARTLTAVANHLFVSQPYVTQVLQAAERQYHVTLIKRDTLPIQLTAAGSSLLKQLERLIADENTLTQQWRYLPTNIKDRLPLASIRPSLR